MLRRVAGQVLDVAGQLIVQKSLAASGPLTSITPRCVRGRRLSLRGCASSAAASPKSVTSPLSMRAPAYQEIPASSSSSFRHIPSDSELKGPGRCGKAVFMKVPPGVSSDHPGAS
jgi:hypothetical protein